MRLIKQSSAYALSVLMVSSSDHITGQAGATLAITASKSGGAFASISPAVTDLGSGWYSLALTGAMTGTLGDLALHIDAAGCDPSDPSAEVVAFDPGDSTALGLSRIDAAVSSRSTLTQGQILSDAIPFRGGYIDSDLGDIKQAVDDLDDKAVQIRNKTNNLPSDPSSESVLEAAIATRAAPGAQMTLTSGEESAVAAAVMASVVEGTISLTQILRIIMSGVALKSNGMDLNAPNFRDLADGKNRISGTIDVNGNRLTVTVDGT